jgi:putative intracellular protease/amidase
MTTIVTILTHGFADWETALLNAGARQYFGIDTRFASVGGEPVVSAAGLKVLPDMALEEINPDQIDALLVNGGTAWSGADAPDITRLLQATRDAGKTIGAICDGTLPLARAGLLDDVAHTSNGPDNLTPTGYRGASLYRDQPEAVRDGKIVTAPGTAPVSFMGAVLETLGLRNRELDYYLGLYAAEHRQVSAS